MSMTPLRDDAKEVFNPGPVPHAGWWLVNDMMGPAWVFYDEDMVATAYGSYDQHERESFINDLSVEESVLFATETADAPGIAWSWHWPQGARVPRIDPETSIITGEAEAYPLGGCVCYNARGEQLFIATPTEAVSEVEDALTALPLDDAPVPVNQPLDNGRLVEADEEVTYEKPHGVMSADDIKAMDTEGRVPVRKRKAKPPADPVVDVVETPLADLKPEDWGTPDVILPDVAQDRFL